MNNKGLTLIELILAICILSLISFILIPSSNILLNFKEQRELREFINDLNYARNNAIVESSIYYVTLYPFQNYYLIQKIEHYPKTIKRKEFANGIKIKKTSFHGNSFKFYDTGSTNKVGTINLENSKGEKIEITIGVATGKIRIYFK